MKLEVGQKIKAYLEANGISQKFLSEKTGIDTPKLNLALNGKRKLTFPEYETVCWALGVNTDKFLKPRMPDESRKPCSMNRAEEG